MSEMELKSKAAGIFFKAADYIRQYGWQEKGMSLDGQPRCSMGALASAYEKQAWEGELSELMYEALYRELNGLSLTQYNNKVKSGDKVVQLYEKVAKSLVS
jgi:hypothetical protein